MFSKREVFHILTKQIKHHTLREKDLILFENKDVSFIITAAVWLLRQYSLILLEPDIQLCSFFSIYILLYILHNICIQICMNCLQGYINKIYECLRFYMNRLFSFLFCFVFFLLRIFCQKNIFALPNLEITSHFAKCEAIIRTLEFENTFGEFDEAEQGCYKA